MLLSLNFVLSPRDVASAHRGRGWILAQAWRLRFRSRRFPSKCSALLQYMGEGFHNVPVEIRSNPNERHRWCQGGAGIRRREERGRWRDVCFPSLGLGGGFVLRRLSYVMLVPSIP